MFIVIDSIDGGGSETQGSLVTEKLRSKGLRVDLRKYPNYDSPVGQMIRKFLYESNDLRVEQQFLLFGLQHVSDAPVIKEGSEKGIVIADRYFTTSMVYQSLKGLPEDIILRFAKDFGIMQPDISFFLDVTPETAFKWKQGEGKELNYWEKDLSFIRETYDKYNDFVDRQVWANWVRVSGERSKEEIAEDIVAQILAQYEK